MPGVGLTNKLRAVLFDKDGVLVDINRTWGPATVALLELISDADADKLRFLAQALNVSIGQKSIAPESPLLKIDVAEYGNLFSDLLGQPRSNEFDAFVDRTYVELGAKFVAFQTDLDRLFNELKRMNYLIGVSTNDFEKSARDQLRDFGCYLDFVAGADSGWGVKPEPDHILKFAEKYSLTTSEIFVVGDTMKDIQAAIEAESPCAAILSDYTSNSDTVFFKTNKISIFSDIEQFVSWLKRQ